MHMSKLRFSFRILDARERFMQFYTFGFQQERRKMGSSYFIEIQYCRLTPDTPIENIFSGDLIQYWENDSLYIYGDDDNAFFNSYGKIFAHGLYANGKTGVVDLCGINYYSPAETEWILKALQNEALPDQKKLMHWLEKAKSCCGFYILGL